MKQKILVVEDDRDLSESIEEIFSDKGYFVATAFDAFTAFRLIEENRYDIILLDLKFPGNGFNILEKSGINELKTRLFIITGKDLKTATCKEQKLLQAAEDIFIKPFDVEDLLAKITG